VYVRLAAVTASFRSIKIYLKKDIPGGPGDVEGKEAGKGLMTM